MSSYGDSQEERDRTMIEKLIYNSLLAPLYCTKKTEFHIKFGEKTIFASTIPSLVGSW